MTFSWGFPYTIILFLFKLEGPWLNIIFGLKFDDCDGIIFEVVNTWGCKGIILDCVKNGEGLYIICDRFIIPELLPTDDGRTHVVWGGFVIITWLKGLLAWGT